MHCTIYTLRAWDHASMVGFMIMVLLGGVANGLIRNYLECF